MSSEMLKNNKKEKSVKKLLILLTICLTLCLFFSCGDDKTKGIYGDPDNLKKHRITVYGKGNSKGLGDLAVFKDMKAMKTFEFKGTVANQKELNEILSSPAVDKNGIYGFKFEGDLTDITWAYYEKGKGPDTTVTDLLFCESLEHIGPYAFGTCWSLKKVKFLRNASTIDVDPLAFPHKDASHPDFGIVFDVPAESVGAYKKALAPWLDESSKLNYPDGKAMVTYVDSNGDSHTVEVPVPNGIADDAVLADIVKNLNGGEITDLAMVGTREVRWDDSQNGDLAPLDNLTFDSSIEKIKENSFINSTDLDTVNFTGKTAPVIEDRAFPDFSDPNFNPVVVVPNGTKKSYTDKFPQDADVKEERELPGDLTPSTVGPSTLNIVFSAQYDWTRIGYSVEYGSKKLKDSLPTSSPVDALKIKGIEGLYTSDTFTASSKVVNGDGTFVKNTTYADANGAWKYQSSDPILLYAKLIK